MAPGEASIYLDGPWSHRSVSANGTRFHIAESGDGPLVLLLHGFPQFWWTWRHQLASLAAAGFRAVAPDLRGYGASDKPPRGYDSPTLAADVAALVTSLGESDAMIVGNDVGGTLAWAVGARHPQVVRSLVVLGAAHPLRMREAVRPGSGSHQRQASSYAIRTFQVPRRPENLLSRQDSTWVRDLYDQWSGPRWRAAPTYPGEISRYAEAMRIHPVSFCGKWPMPSSTRHS